MPPTMRSLDPSIESSSLPWLCARILVDVTLPTVSALLAIRSFNPPHRAPQQAQAWCQQDIFARFGLVTVPPLLVTVLYTVALAWHLRSALGDVLEASPWAWLRSLALPPFEASDARWVTTAWVMAGLGGGLRCWCYKELQHFFTFTLAVLDDHKVISSGPYGVVRHPSYSGLMLVTAGLTTLMQKLPVPIVGKCPPGRAVCVHALCAYFIWTRISNEEEMMLRGFAEQARARRRRQRYAVDHGANGNGKIASRSGSDRRPYSHRHSPQHSIDSTCSTSAGESSMTRVAEPTKHAASSPVPIQFKLQLGEEDLKRLKSYGSVTAAAAPYLPAARSATTTSPGQDASPARGCVVELWLDSQDKDKDKDEGGPNTNANNKEAVTTTAANDAADDERGVVVYRVVSYQDDVPDGWQDAEEENEYEAYRRKVPYKLIPFVL